MKRQDHAILGGFAHPSSSPIMYIGFPVNGFLFKMENQKSLVDVYLIVFVLAVGLISDC